VYYHINHGWKINHRKNEKELMKILLFANTDWYLFNFRLHLARTLQALGHEVVLVSPPGDYGPRLIEAGFRWLPFPFARRGINPLFEFSTIARLRKLYQSEKPDAVHHFTIKCVLYGSSAAKQLGIRHVINSITGLGYVFLGQSWSTQIIRKLVINFYQRALVDTHVIFQNPDDLALFKQIGLVNADQVTLIRGSGIDIEHFRPLPEQGSYPLVVLPGRLLWDKGVGEFVEAARLLRASGVRARFALVGDSDLSNPAAVPLDQLSSWQREGIVEWWGWHDDMRSVFALSHVVCLPSYREGVPRVLAEAAACARPLVATDVPGCREVVIHNSNGLLVRSHDPEALANALRMLIENPSLRRRMGDEGRRMAEKEFAEGLITDETLAYYNRLGVQIKL
jgi:glycosyltransferase involved in cell wall biosynthesis